MIWYLLKALEIIGSIYLLGLLGRLIRPDSYLKWSTTSGKIIGASISNISRWSVFSHYIDKVCYFESCDGQHKIMATVEPEVPKRLKGIYANVLKKIDIYVSLSPIADFSQSKAEGDYMTEGVFNSVLSEFRDGSSQTIEIKRGDHKNVVFWLSEEPRDGVPYRCCLINRGRKVFLPGYSVKRKNMWTYKKSRGKLKFWEIIDHITPDYKEKIKEKIKGNIRRYDV